MAGFFGLFDYSKPGPGVDKNQPKKKSFVVFFEIYFRKFWTLILANLLYVLVSLPVLTRGLAAAGLTFITRNYAREKHAFISGDFFDTIKKNWKQALPVGIINLVITAVMVFDVYWFLNAKGGVVGIIMLALICFAFLVFTFMKYYMDMMLITFKFSIKQLYKNALIFAFVGIKANLVISIGLLLLYAVGVALYCFLGVLGIVLLILNYILLFPAFRSLLIQFCIFPKVKELIIDPYYKEHPGEDSQAIRDLNIEDTYSIKTEEEIEKEQEEVIFKDMGKNQPEETDKKWSFPKQYSEKERSKHRMTSDRSGRDDNDDDTI